MKQIAAVTFHHAHNFGSVLQAYALKEYVTHIFAEKHLPVSYQIIDFYTPEQQELYNIFKKNNSVKNLVKNTFSFFYAKELRIKYNKFEQFLNDYCKITQRYKNENDLLINPPLADVYISGSDQIWNVRAKDFRDCYFLNFVSNTKKVSYAASFGPLDIDWEHYDAEKYSSFLHEYNFISVRERGSAENVTHLTGKVPPVHVDPTLLLTAEQWRRVQSNANYKNGKYILLYCLEPSADQLMMAKTISKKLNLPILLTRFNNKQDILNMFVKKYDAGPRDFLSYIDHAALVLTSSFHGTVFSLLYEKPFYVLNGKSDKRIYDILTRTNLETRSLEKLSEIDKVTLNPPEYSKLQLFLDKERAESKLYLQNAFEL